MAQQFSLLPLSSAFQQIFAEREEFQHLRSHENSGLGRLNTIREALERLPCN